MSAGAEARTAELVERFRVIREQAHATNERRVGELATAVEHFAAGTLTRDERDHAAGVAHKLAGSAGTFGYHGVSDIAHELEQWLASERSDAPGGLPQDWITALRDGMAAAPDDPDD